MTPTPFTLPYNLLWELPLVILVVSLVYSATRFEDWPQIIHEAIRWMIRMSLFLLGIVLILSGLGLEDSSMALRAILTITGIILEVGLLFVK
ncbi:MAG: hypothetical protein ACK4RK_00095 [Gemmataceae bacterium]